MADYFMITGSNGRRYQVHAHNADHARQVEQEINQRIAAGDPDLKGLAKGRGYGVALPRNRQAAPDRRAGGGIEDLVRRGTGAGPRDKPRSDLAALATNGALFGLNDELAGAMGVLYNAAKAPFSSKASLSDSGRVYREWRDREAANQDETRRQHPNLAPVLEIAGGMASLPAKAATGARGLLNGPRNLWQTMKTGAKAGATAGAVSGFGYGRGADGSLGGAALGAVGGAALGAALPVGVEALRRTVSTARKFISPESGVGRQLVVRAMRDDGIAPSQAGHAISQAHERGVPAMVADLGDNLRGLTGSVSRRPGAARTLARNAITERQAGQTERVRGHIASNLGPVANVRDQSDHLIDLAKTEAAPLYDDVYAQSGRVSDELDSLLNTPAGKQALNRARAIAANEREDPTALGFGMDADGNVVLNPVRPDLYGSHAQARAELTDAQHALRNARRRVGGDTASATQRVEQARDALRQAEAGLRDAPTAGTAATVRGYSPKTLDYIKRGLDDVLEPYRNQITGKLDLDEAGRAINGVRADYVKEVDRLHPGYADARAAYAGPARENQALLLGQQSLDATPDEIRRMLARMSPSEQAQFALGHRSAMAQSIDKKVDGADKVNTLLGTPQKRKALAEAHRGADFDRFVQAMADEKMGNETYRTVATGSPTADRLAFDGSTDDGALLQDLAGRAIKGAANGGGVTGMVAEGLHAMRDVGRFGAGQAGQRAREDAAALLTETDPEALRRAVQEAMRQDLLRRMGQRGIYRKQASGSLLGGRGLGAIGGWAMQPSEDAGY